MGHRRSAPAAIATDEPIVPAWPLVLLVIAGVVAAHVPALAFPGRCCVAPPDGIVSWWPGEGNANDAVGGNNGIGENGATFSQGLCGEAFSFDGVDDVVRVPSSASLDPPGSFTIEGWVYQIRDASGGGTLAGKWGDGGAWSDQRAYNVGVGPGGYIGFGISDDVHQNDGGFHKMDSAPNAVPLNAWTHFAAVYDSSSGTRRLHVNGIVVATRTDAPIVVKPSIADFEIGAGLQSPTGVGYPFPGLIDELTFYSRALTQTEIGAIVVAGSAGKCATPPPDADGDGVCDAGDDCPSVADPSQLDRDADGIGDACDPFPDDGDNEQAQCEVDRDQCREELSICLGTIGDADGDGENDETDRCAATPPSTAVDDAGCSVNQFCSRIQLDAPAARRHCRRGDWRNDEPGSIGRDPDCVVERNPLRCTPAGP